MPAGIKFTIAYDAGLVRAKGARDACKVFVGGELRFDGQ